AGRDYLSGQLNVDDVDKQLRYLSLLELALRDMRGVAPPARWSDVAGQLYDSSDARIKQLAESLGAVFADEQLFQRMRARLANAQADDADKQTALAALTQDRSPRNLPLYLAQLDHAELRSRVLPALAGYEDPAIATQILSRFDHWQDADRAVALELLCGRTTWADKLLDAIESGVVSKKQITAYHARQIASLGNDNLTTKLQSVWGTLSRTSDEVNAEINRLVAAYEGAPLWAYSEAAGAGHFQKICATCHLPHDAQQNIAPKLNGSGSKGVRYIVENVLDPNAVIGKDFQARIVILTDGRTMTGLIESESDSAITLRTATNRETIARREIEEIETSPNSFMPTGLLDALNDRERLELLLYVMEMK
ncbi:MAG: hypothetical protein KDA92_26145, partial [Planctomycetales bacterium]|nr:hypothetical protein [Planctomycetales bacterium]